MLIDGAIEASAQRQGPYDAQPSSDPPAARTLGLWLRAHQPGTVGETWWHVVYRLEDGAVRPVEVMAWE